uniref:Uncharacterized protein n=1 Tax=Glossina austeni TaxID=7395 RepID=A0A1A9UZ58_GLOAU
MYSTPEPEPNILVTKPTREYHTLLTYSATGHDDSNGSNQTELNRSNMKLLRFIIKFVKNGRRLYAAFINVVIVFKQLDMKCLQGTTHFLKLFMKKVSVIVIRMEIIVKMTTLMDTEWHLKCSSNVIGTICRYVRIAADLH